MSKSYVKDVKLIKLLKYQCYLLFHGFPDEIGYSLCFSGLIIVTVLDVLAGAGGVLAGAGDVLAGAGGVSEEADGAALAKPAEPVFCTAGVFWAEVVF